MLEITIFHTIYWTLFAFALLYLLPRAFWQFRQQVHAHRSGEGIEKHPRAVTPTSGGLPLEHINVVDALMIFLIFMLYYSTGTADAEITMNTLYMGIFAQIFIIGMVALAWGFRTDLRKALGLRRVQPKHLLWSIGVVIIAWTVTGLAQVLGYFDFLESYFGKPPLQDAVLLLQSSTDPLMLGLIALVACIGAPLSEEVLFRGYLYPVTQKFAGRSVALVFSGLLFAVIHYNLASVPTLFVMGVALAYAYEHTRSLWVPIIAHCIFNSATVLYQILSRFSEAGVTP